MKHMLYSIGEIMDNLFNIEGIEINQDLLERTNPISNTARMTLFQLAAAGYDDAKAVAERLNLTREDTQDSKTVRADEDDLFINSIIMGDILDNCIIICSFSKCQ